MVRQTSNTGPKQSFSAHSFLSTLAPGKQLVSFGKHSIIFTQGDASESVFFIQSGKVKLSVVSRSGKEAILGIFGECNFVGENGLVGRPRRLLSATAMTDCVLMRIEKKAMTMAMSHDLTLASGFVQYLVERNIQHQEDLVDQLLNSSEKRLARALLLLADSNKNAAPGSRSPKITQEMLAEMVGTTRSRVSFFLNRFRKLGLIQYGAGNSLRVHSSLLQVVAEHQYPATPNRDCALLSEPAERTARMGVYGPERAA